MTRIAIPNSKRQVLYRILKLPGGPLESSSDGGRKVARHLGKLIDRIAQRNTGLEIKRHGDRRQLAQVMNR